MLKNPFLLHQRLFSKMFSVYFFLCLYIRLNSAPPPHCQHLCLLGICQYNLISSPRDLKMGNRAYNKPPQLPASLSPHLKPAPHLGCWSKEGSWDSVVWHWLPLPLDSTSPGLNGTSFSDFPRISQPWLIEKPNIQVA